MNMFNILLLVIILYVTSLAGCGESQQLENYHLTSIEDINLNIQNHPHGFTRQECFYCHVKIKIHRENRLNSPLVDLARDLVNQSGLASCSACHGKNGATE